MGCGFDNIADRLSSATAPAATVAGTIGVWFSPSWNSGDGVTHGIWWRTTTPGDDAPSFQKFLDNNIYVGWQGNGLGEQRIVIADAGIFVANTWAYHLFTWSDAANTEYYYVDNVQKGSRLAALTTWQTQQGRIIGNYGNAAVFQDARGILAEYGEWSVVLDASERAALALGYSPLLICPQSLVSYCPLIAALRPEIDYKSAVPLINAGWVDPANHPRIIHPSPGGGMYRFDSAGGVPRHMDYYRRRLAG